VTTDRQSGFDRNLGAIPFKGQVLNRTSLYWFEQTRGIVGNHVISASPHANALLARKCTVLPIEFVVRGYMTGSTDTSIWTQYAEGRAELLRSCAARGHEEERAAAQRTSSRQPRKRRSTTGRLRQKRLSPKAG
jgi:phosphoribosylaminoimidazole-succinocarboxamide synthase